MEISAKWGRLDFALHSVGYARAEDLHGRVIDCSADGFAHAMQVSVHSFLRMAKLAEPLMTSGGCLLAITFYGAVKAVPHYGVMGPVKAALESAVSLHVGRARRKADPGQRHFPGPVATRSASGLKDFDEMLDQASKHAAQHRLVTPDDVGSLAAFLVSDAAAAMTGNISYVDAGYHAVG